MNFEDPRAMADSSRLRKKTRKKQTKTKQNTGQRQTYRRWAWWTFCRWGRGRWRPALWNWPSRSAARPPPGCAAGPTESPTGRPAPVLHTQTVHWLVLLLDQATWPKPIWLRRRPRPTPIRPSSVQPDHNAVPPHQTRSNPVQPRRKPSKTK